MTLKHWRFRISLAMFPLLHCCTRSSTGISVAVSNTLYLGGQFFHSFLLLNHLGWQQEMKIFYSPRVPLFELCCLLSCICLPCLRLHWDTILHVTCLNIFENHRFFETQWKHFTLNPSIFFLDDLTLGHRVSSWRQLSGTAFLLTKKESCCGQKVPGISTAPNLPAVGLGGERFSSRRITWPRNWLFLSLLSS